MAGMNLASNSVYAYNNTGAKTNTHCGVVGRRGFPRYKISRPADETAWLRAVETPPISDQLQAMVLQVQTALPNVLALTNKIAAVLDNAGKRDLEFECHALSKRGR